MRDTDVVTGRFLAEKIREWLRANPKKSQADLARAAGISSAQLSLLLSTERGAGRKTLRGLGKVLGMTPDEIEASAASWGEANGVKQPQQGPPALPNRELAIRVVEETAGLHPETIALVRAMSSPIDLVVDAWVAVLMSVDRRTSKTRAA